MEVGVSFQGPDTKPVEREVLMNLDPVGNIVSDAGIQWIGHCWFWGVRTQAGRWVSGYELSASQALNAVVLALNGVVNEGDSAP